METGMPTTRAWNGWYHVEGNTYGTWLRGDFRGWREWKHHEHVEGDYRYPPNPQVCIEPFLQSRRQMKGEPVKLSRRQREAAGRDMIETFVGRLGRELLALSLDAVHFHILCRITAERIREEVGRAKKSASHVLRAYGLPGAVWGKRCAAKPIHDRAHQVNTFNYILEHARQGAWIWSYREGLYWRQA
jgi:hypothetical protein